MLPEAHVIKEFRIPLPLEVEEYHIGQLWSVAQASKNETGGGDGVEVVINEPFSEGFGQQPSWPLKADGKVFKSGQYTHKIYHISQKVPAFIRMLAPRGSLEIVEKAWNAYPYCRTILTNPYMKDNFFICIESYHAPGNGEMTNVHCLTGKDLEKREVVHLDIANDKIPPKEYKAEWDPTKVRSEKAGRGPLVPDKEGSWKTKVKPIMCCYKLVRVVFKWFGLQNKVEKTIMINEARLFLHFHRQVVCWLDNYYGMTMDDIRRIEQETKDELAKKRENDALCGMVAEEGK